MGLNRNLYNIISYFKNQPQLYHRLKTTVSKVSDSTRNNSHIKDHRQKFILDPGKMITITINNKLKRKCQEEV